MKISLEEKNHVYRLNNNIANISVTELLAKHDLAPKYDFVDEEVLKASSKKGTDIHKDLENILNKADYTPETKQGRQFAKWVSENLDSGVGEQKLGLEFGGWRLCGTADVMGIMKDGTLLVGDHKITSVFHREYVTWQVSILDYMARRLGKEPVNGKILNWKGASNFICFHYDPKTSKMKAITLTKIPDEEIERLIDCEYNGEKYYRKELVAEEKFKQKFLKAEEKLLKMELAYKKAQENAQQLREQMLKLFEEQHILKWKSNDGLLQVTYVAPAETTRVDTNKLKKEYPQVYSECQTISKKKSYVRITIKQEDDED